MEFQHIPVLYEEVLHGLALKEGGTYVDGTVGGGGHASGILSAIGANGRLLAIDQDTGALAAAKERLAPYDGQVTFFHANFVEMPSIIDAYAPEGVDGILIDIGVSSPQIDNAQRGFSYMHDAPLDMRMNKDSSLSAYDVVNNYSAKDLVRIFREYGEEKHAYKIAKCIDEARSVKNIETTFELVDIIDKCYPYKEKRNGHPAKKVFQAIRIEVNNELEELVVGLKSSLDLLDVGGRVVVITFHSLEDRIVKNLFKKMSDISPVVKGMPNVPLEMLPDFKLVTNKPIIPSDYEMSSNPRSKSAKLRVIERVK